MATNINTTTKNDYFETNDNFETPPNYNNIASNQSNDKLTDSVDSSQTSQRVQSNEKLTDSVDSSQTSQRVQSNTNQVNPVTSQPSADSKYFLAGFETNGSTVNIKDIYTDKHKIPQGLFSKMAEIQKKPEIWTGIKILDDYKISDKEIVEEKHIEQKGGKRANRRNRSRKLNRTKKPKGGMRRNTRKR